MNFLVVSLGDTGTAVGHLSAGGSYRICRHSGVVDPARACPKEAGPNATHPATTPVTPIRADTCYFLSLHCSHSDGSVPV